jgi:hypothetical protein
VLGEAPIGPPPKSPVGRLNWSGLSATAPRWGRFFVPSGNNGNLGHFCTVVQRNGSRVRLTRQRKFCAARQEKPTERKPAGLIAIVLRRTALLRPY